ncbi:OmpA family protein [Thioalkalivibrio sp. ALJT]|uniref:OmpA family protein n=1 Tax=Thioalkalivibrio sp. ALJT TaxID=1158146 RepID=UPI000382AEEB
MAGWVAAALLSVSGAGASELEGAGDHSEVPRVAGSFIVFHESSDFDRLSIPTGAWDGDQFESFERLEGQVLRLSYNFEDPGVTTLRVKRSYLQALEARGFEILFSGSEEELSSGAGRTFFRESGLFDRGARDCCRVANRDRQVRYMAARSEAGNVLAGIAVFNARRVDGPAVSKAIVTAAEMDATMDHQPLTADEMETGLVEDGRVAVPDILFEVNSAAILPESAEALESIAELMNAQSSMELLVVGHTDNTGDFDYNVSLSLQRAQSVVNWLRDEYGIAGARLQAAGAGMMAPVTTNRTEEGRAQNRRVELVERGR